MEVELVGRVARRSHDGWLAARPARGPGAARAGCSPWRADVVAARPGRPRSDRRRALARPGRRARRPRAAGDPGVGGHRGDAAEARASGEPSAPGDRDARQAMAVVRRRLGGRRRSARSASSCPACRRPCSSSSPRPASHDRARASSSGSSPGRVSGRWCATTAPAWACRSRAKVAAIASITVVCGLSALVARSRPWLSLVIIAAGAVGVGLDHLAGSDQARAPVIWMGRGRTGARPSR